MQALKRVLVGANLVIHEAGKLEVGQSMYTITRIASASTLGTVTLLKVIADAKNRLRKLILASSMSIYGESVYHRSVHTVSYYPDYARYISLRSMIGRSTALSLIPNK